MLDDFEAATMTPESSAANNTGTVRWRDLGRRWGGRNKDGDTADWQIVAGSDGRELRCLDSDNRNTQCAAAFRVSLSDGADWALEFDAPSGANWNDIDIYLGVDDGDNTGDERMIDASKTNGTLYPDTIDGAWVHVINNGWNGAETYGIDAGNHVTIKLDAEGNLPADPSAYDILVIRMQMPDQHVGNLVIDNLALSSAEPPVPPELRIARSGTDLVFTWDGVFGKRYDLVTTDAAGLSAPPGGWTPVETDLAAELPVTSRVHPWDGRPEAYFAVIERDGPPMFTDDFEADLGWTTGGIAGDAPGTAWERGVPDWNFGPTAAHSGTRCFGTNLAGDHTADADVWLRSPVIDLRDPAIRGARLRFHQFRDTDSGMDLGSVRILDPGAGDAPLAGVDALFTDIGGAGAAWEELVADLPAEALGRRIRIEFRFASNGDPSYAGWYVDDVVVEANE